jgi:DNA-binding HxlR family transcriptional regulator
MLGSKWTLHILHTLSCEEHGFNELKRELDGVTATMLSRRLSELQSEGIVSREVVSTSPPSTRYSLTESGVEMVDVLRDLDELELQRGASD